MTMKRESAFTPTLTPSVTASVQGFVPDLLMTRLTPPPIHRSTLARQHLFDRLNQGITGKLTVLAAPAGSGKTTLVSTWLATFPVGTGAWLTLEKGDNDPVRFWRYLITASQAFRPGLGGAALQLLQTVQPPFEAVLTLWINDMVTLSPEIKHLLVLDDYHLITASSLQQSMTFLLDHLPASLHLVMTTRHQLTLPLARLRVRHELTELTTRDLRFSHQEMHALLEQSVPSDVTADLSPETITVLENRTEGWAAGVHLATLALRDKADMSNFPDRFSGSYQQIFDYLIEDVFAMQPPALQAFLLKTAFLKRFNVDLCAAVVGISQNESHQLLAQIQQTNLFLTPLQQGWYRYHALFAEALQHYARKTLIDTSLADAGVREIYEQASRWYEAQGLADDAVETAFAAGNFLRAARLIEQFIDPFTVNNEYDTLCGMIEQLPDAILQQHPRLSFTFAIAILFASDRHTRDTLHRLQKPLSYAEQSWCSAGSSREMGQVLAFRSMAIWWQGDYHEAFTTAHQALELLPEEDVHWRAVCLANLGFEALLAGRLNDAQKINAQAVTLFEMVGNNYGKRACMILQGEIIRNQGELRHARWHYQELLKIAEEDPSDYAYALYVLAALAYEWDDLEAAMGYASQAQELAKQQGEYDIHIRSILVMSRVLSARGEASRARQLLRETEALPMLKYSPLPQRELYACLARQALASGDLNMVEEWLTQRKQHTEAQSEDVMRLQQEQEALLVARLFIIQGKYQDALWLLDQWQVETHAQEHKHTVLEILMIKALAYFAREDHIQAHHLIAKALSMAQPEGYQRLFIDEGQPMAKLIRSALAVIGNQSTGLYARQLLQKLEALAPPADVLLVEPLSQQEKRVLRLLSAGLSNPEIAQELIVSINTVKTQVKSIYRKLNISSRDEIRNLNLSLQL